MTPTNSQTRQLRIAAVVILSGIVFSGPVAVGLVELFAPQPQWQDVSTFIRHYSWIQCLSYIFGFLIAGGFIVFMSILASACQDSQRPLAYAALTFTGVSASLIFFNYILQTAFVPLWLHTSEVIVSMATMANPNSLGWSLEMYGYGILGLATAFAAPLFQPTKRQRLISYLLATNCILSVIGAILVPLIPGWVLTPFGMIVGALWNVLVAAIMVLVILEFRVAHA